MAFPWLSLYCESGRLKVAHDDDKCRRGYEPTVLVALPCPRGDMIYDLVSSGANTSNITSMQLPLN